MGFPAESNVEPGSEARAREARYVIQMVQNPSDPEYKWNGCGHRGRPCYRILQELGSPYYYGLRYDDH